MDLNGIIFPAPKCSYSKDSRNLIWVDSSPINTPVYHVEARIKAREQLQQQLIKEKENHSNQSRRQSTSSSSSLFGMCMNNLPDTSGEVEVMVGGTIKPIVLDEKFEYLTSANSTRNLNQHSPFTKSPFSRLADTLPSSPPCPSSVFRANDITNIISPRANTISNSSSINLNSSRADTHGKCSASKTAKPTIQEDPSEFFHSPIKARRVRDVVVDARNNENWNAHAAEIAVTSTLINTPLKRAAEFGPELKNVTDTRIPCLYLPCLEGSDKLMIYFHGNAEDLGYSYDFISNLRKYLKLNILAVEYPGYGLYEGKPSSDQILSDADSIYEFARAQLRVAAQDIIVFGRSIGSGPASYLAGTRSIGGLILMCPYTSIRGVAKDVAGGFLSYLVADRFRNVDYLKNAKSLTLLIHGEKDRLIPYQHSIELMKSLADKCLIHLSPSMTHNDFDLFTDLIYPIKKFFKHAAITIRTDPITIPEQFYATSRQNTLSTR